LRILHPTDFSDASDAGFAHALKLALLARGSIHILHIKSSSAHRRWEDFPKVRQTLIRWGLLTPGSLKRDVARLGIRVRKTVARGQNPVNAILRQLKKTPADLLVVGVHQRTGLRRFLAQRVAQPLARSARIPTLFIPETAVGFVSTGAGDLTLEHILIPARQSAALQSALQAAVGVIQIADQNEGRITILYVGAASDAPQVKDVALLNGWTLELISIPGQPDQEIIAYAREKDVDLIVMATQGRQGLLDLFFGSTIERVLEEAPTPVLAVHVDAA